MPETLTDVETPGEGAGPLDNSYSDTDVFITDGPSMIPELVFDVPEETLKCLRSLMTLTRRWAQTMEHGGAVLINSAIIRPFYLD